MRRLVGRGQRNGCLVIEPNVMQTPPSKSERWDASSCHRASTHDAVRYVRYLAFQLLESERAGPPHSHSTEESPSYSL